MPAGPSIRPPSLLISSSSPARPLPSSSHHSPSNSPFRYVQLQDPQEKPLADPLAVAPPRSSVDHPLSGPSRNPGRLSPVLTPSSPLHPASRSQGSRKHGQHHIPRNLPRSAPPPLPSPFRGRPQGFRIPDSIKPWLGIGSWAVTSIAFLLAIALYKKEVFTGLDQLSLYLQSLGTLGYAILFCLIFITTIPPFPLYSTLTILSGYTFGPWLGAAISYTAALSGAVIVFLLSRHYLRGPMSRFLAHTVSLKRVVRAIEKRPKLLLLIRVAPYPYNLMNVLLASSHILTFETYFTCTALSLFKVIIHTSVGSGIHSFAGYHAVIPEGLDGEDVGGRSEESENGGLAQAWAITGIVLCIAIFVYLSYVARRAVDDELEDETAARPGRDEEEAVAFLSPLATDGESRTAGGGEDAEEMREVQQQP